MTEHEKAAQKKNVILIFSTLMVTMLLASLSQMVFSSALPTIVGELNGVDHMAWVITAYMLASTIMMPVYGKVSDIFGRKPLLIKGVLASGVGPAFRARREQGLPLFVPGAALDGLLPGFWQKSDRQGHARSRS